MAQNLWLGQTKLSFHDKCEQGSTVSVVVPHRLSLLYVNLGPVRLF